MAFPRFKSVFNPDMYHGWGKKRSFFEGWYFKLVNRAADKIYAIIPGISIDNDGRKHAFIQVLDGIKATRQNTISSILKNSEASSDRFKISIAGNIFTKNYI